MNFGYWKIVIICIECLPYLGPYIFIKIIKNLGNNRLAYKLRGVTLQTLHAGL